MSSNAEQGPNAGLLARAKEATKNPFLVEFGKRVPNPRQAPIIGEVLGLTLEERKNARAIAWLKKYQPATLQAILSEASEAENKNAEEKEMEVKWGREHYYKEVARYEEKLFSKIGSIFEKLLLNTDLVTVWNKGYNWGLFVIPSQARDTVGVNYQMANDVATLNVHYSLAHLKAVGQPKPIYEAFKEAKGWTELTVKVYDKAYLNLAKRFVRRYEKRSKCAVPIIKEY